MEIQVLHARLEPASEASFVDSSLERAPKCTIATNTSLHRTVRYTKAAFTNVETRSDRPQRTLNTNFLGVKDGIAGDKLSGVRTHMSARVQQFGHTEQPKQSQAEVHASRAMQW
ncbi:hypothetical protein F441_16593 [Phytophthora nicotianae CJ01A1]|uniref:Uncharacterized protein n=1 Tax=Phytophthora nicotianae CJ01A1 TaxID=1317063 RepID=W2W9E2_PHYNI|nr:hypothetical protein F441_16593 [Phytophthora nicotianae CJ01A1]